MLILKKIPARLQQEKFDSLNAGSRWRRDYFSAWWNNGGSYYKYNNFGNELYNVLDQNGEIIETSPDDIISKLGDEFAKDDKPAIYRDIRFRIDDRFTAL